MIDRTSEAQPTTDVLMVGDVPIPVDVPPIDIPPLPVPTIPNVGPAISYVVHGAEAAWSDVASWVSDRWHGLLGGISAVASVTFQDVSNIVDVALSAEQTAWASFIGTLESWINASVAAINATIGDVANFAVSEAIFIGQRLATVEAGLYDIILAEVRGIDATIAQQWENTVHGIEFGSAAVEAWAIDNIYTPLLDEVTGLGERTLTGLETVLDDAKAYAEELVHSESLARIAAIAGLVTAVATITSWIDDCGEPMCEQLGPKTDLGKLLKTLNLAADALLLSELASLTEPQLLALMNEIAAKLGQLIGDVETMFLTDGDTLGQLITTTIGQQLFGAG